MQMYCKNTNFLTAQVDICSVCTNFISAYVSTVILLVCINLCYGLGRLKYTRSSLQQLLVTYIVMTLLL